MKTWIECTRNDQFQRLKCWTSVSNSKASGYVHQGWGFHFSKAWIHVFQESSSHSPDSMEQVCARAGYVLAFGAQHWSAQAVCRSRKVLKSYSSCVLIYFQCSHKLILQYSLILNFPIHVLWNATRACEKHNCNWSGSLKSSFYFL